MFLPSDPEQDAATRTVSGGLVPQPPRLRAPPNLPRCCAAEEVPEHSEGSGAGRALHRVHCQCVALHRWVVGYRERWQGPVGTV